MAQIASPLLEARNITHRFSDLVALEQISVALEPETFTCLIGPSGSGKSTLLRIFAGLLHLDQGEVLLHGAPFTRPDKRISLVFQDANLMPWRTVRQNIVLPLELAGVSRADQNSRAEYLLHLLGLAEFANAYPSSLSGGMAQRLAIGRALIHDPEVLLLDEPFGALDALTREQVSEELLKIWVQARKTVFMITHSIPEAVLLSDRVLVMSPRPGSIVADISIDLPRPRSMEMATRPKFVELEARIRAELKPQLKQN